MKKEGEFKYSSIVVELLSYNQGLVQVGIEVRDNEVVRVLLTWPHSRYSPNFTGHVLPGGIAWLEDLYIAIGNVLDRVKNMQEDRVEDGS